MTQATKVRKYKKPNKSFPLTPHKRGWCKKIKGQDGKWRVKIICGHLPPREALDVYHQMIPQLYPQPVEEKLLSPQAPVVAVPLIPAKPTLSVSTLRDKYVAHNVRGYKSGEITDRSLQSIMEVLRPFADAMDKDVVDLTTDDFNDYRFSLSAKYGAYALDRHITQIRAMFNWAHRNGVINSLPQWGDSFDKPSQAQKRKHRQKQNAANGKRLFTPHEIRSLINAAGVSMRAMVLLGINCGMGNTDVARLPKSALDLSRGIMDYPRPKTGNERRAILWPETVAALREAIAKRPVPADRQHSGLVFITREGSPYINNYERLDEDEKIEGIVRVDLITTYFANLQWNAKIVTAGDKHLGRGFYSLRHSFRTYADNVPDQHAIYRIMGHSLPGMSATYVQQIGDDRLKHVSDYVRSQILGFKDENVISVSGI